MKNKRCILIAGGVNPNAVGGAPISILAWIKAFKGDNSYILVCSKDSPKIKNAVSFSKLGHISFNPLCMNFSLKELIKNWIDAFKVLRYLICNQIALSQDQYNSDIKINHGHWYIGADIIVVRFCMKSYIEKLESKGCKNFLINLLDVKTKIILWIEKRMFLSHKTKFIVSLSNIGKNEITTLYNPPAKIKVIGNGIDKEKFSFNQEKRKELREKLHIGEKDIAVIFPGGNMLRKNIKTTIDIFNKIENSDVHYLVVAKDSEIKMMSTLQLPKNIHYLPWSDNFSYYLSASDVMIFPSIYDTGPKTILEAVENGVYVILSQNCGVSEVVNEKCGYVIKNCCDSESYVKAFLRFKKLYNQGKISRDFDSISQTWEHIVNKIKRLFNLL